MSEGKQEIKSEQLHFDPKEFDRILEKNSSKISNGETAPSLRRRRVHVTIYPDVCIPGTFDKPVRITMQELDSKTELRVLRSMQAPAKKGDGTDVDDPSGAGQTLSMSLAKASILALNNRQLAEWQVEQVWEWIGFAGRSALGIAFMEHCTGMTSGFMERSLKSVEID